MADDGEVRFSGSTSTMLGIALVAAVISIALSVWNLSRIVEIETFIRILAVRDASPP